MQVAHVSRDFSLDRVVPFFQPIIDIHNDIVWRYECLARFINVEQQSFVPTELLYLVDRRHSKAHLTHTIFNGSANYFRHINMAWSINLSLQDMLDPEMTDFMRTQLQDYPNPTRISIEIAATNALENRAAFNEFALLSKSLNLNITLDQLDPQQEDLLQLLSLPVEAIKISVKDIRHSQQKTKVAEALKVFFSKAEEKGIDLIAEHIEHKAELDMIRALGIQYAQGFHFSLPKAFID
ncbi:EAL domain-containing protein [Paraglaciecola sp. 25GB23A]|uniref:EAL domain-containing protein n=1 Tax=Paraglaciecola sp. 25GB23A TaxID=3156068 RepID=UPI0032AF768D